MEESLSLRHLELALGTFFLSLGVAWLVFFILKRWGRRLVTRTGNTLDNRLLEALERPIPLAIVLAGLYGVTLALPLSPSLARSVNRGLLAAVAPLSVYVGLRFLGALLLWYREELATTFGLDDRLLSWFRKALPVVGVLLSLYLVLELAGLRPAPLRNWLVQHGSRASLIAATALAISILAGRFLPTALHAIVLREQEGQTEEEIRKRTQTIARVSITTIHLVVLLMAGFMILAELGINIGPLLAGAGIAGIALGFGAQNLVRDIISGLFVILENQYRVGDVARVADIAGLVEDINLRRTVLRDLDGIVHYIPNGEIRVASNLTKGYSRVNLNVSVAYKEDLDRVIQVINRVGKELAEDPAWASLIITPPQALRVDNLGDSGIEIKILGDTKPIQQWAVMGELRLRLKRAFDQEGIEIPWPHTKVYFGNSPQG